MRPTQQLLSAHRDAWNRAMRHPFLRVLEGPVAEAAFRRWLGYEAGWIGQALGGLACAVPQVPRGHRYVVAQALVVLTEELDWLEAYGLEGEREEGLEAADRVVERAFGQGWECSVLVLWTGARLQFDALRGLEPQEELVRAFQERRTSAVVEAFLHDFAELTDLALQKLGMATAGDLLARVVAGQGELWDLGLALLERQE